MEELFKLELSKANITIDNNIFNINAFFFVGLKQKHHEAMKLDHLTTSGCFCMCV